MEDRLAVAINCPEGAWSSRLLLDRKDPPRHTRVLYGMQNNSFLINYLDPGIVRIIARLRGSLFVGV